MFDFENLSSADFGSMSEDRFVNLPSILGETEEKDHQDCLPSDPLAVKVETPVDFNAQRSASRHIQPKRSGVHIVDGTDAGEPKLL